MNQDDPYSLFGDHDPINDNSAHLMDSGIHNWSDSALERLISSRFKGNANALVRQLSKDITHKEQDIVLLRDHYLARERQFYYICAQHANLTHLEVDKLLESAPDRYKLRPERAIQNMIENAMHEKLEIEVQSTSAQQPDSVPVEEKAERYNWLRGWIQSPDGPRYQWSRSMSSLVEPSTQEDEHLLALMELVSMKQSETPMGEPGRSAPFISAIFEDVDPQNSNTPSDTGKLDISYATLQELGRRHDGEKQAVEARWDSFCEKVRLLQGNQRDEANSHEKEPSFGMRAIELLTLDRQASHEALYFTQLQNLVAQFGIPPERRRRLWFELSGGAKLRAPGEFDRLVELARMHANEASLIQSFNQIDLDIHRTMPLNSNFHSRTSERRPIHHRLKRILDAFVVLRSDIGYVQGMNRIVGNLLVADKTFTEEDVFWLFVSLLDESLPRFGGESYFAPASLKHIYRAQTDVQLQLAVFVPRLAAHLNKLQVQVEFITMNWWLLVFTEIFNLTELWYRIVDNLMVSVRADDFLRALSLALFKVNEKAILTLDNYDDVYALMSRGPLQGIVYVDLMKQTRDFERRIHSLKARLPPSEKEPYGLEGPSWM